MIQNNHFCLRHCKHVNAAFSTEIGTKVSYTEWKQSRFHLVSFCCTREARLRSMSIAGGGQHLEQPNVERPIFRILKERKKRVIRFVHFRINFLFFLFELFEHSKYMIIYKIINLWNFDSFPNCKISKILYFSKLNNFRNLIFFETKIFWNFPN